MKINQLFICIIAVAFFDIVSGLNVQAQEPVALKGYIDLALKNNGHLRTAALEVAQSKAMQNASFDPGKTSILLTQDPTSGGNIDNSLAIMQTFSLPGVYRNQRKLYLQQAALTESARAITEAETVKEVRIAYFNYLYGQEKLKVLNFLDSLYKDFSAKATVRQRTGETSNLEKLTAQNKYYEVLLMQKEVQSDLKVYELALQQLVNKEDSLAMPEGVLTELPYTDSMATQGAGNSPLLAYYQQAIGVADSKVKLERSKMLPEISIGYSHQLVIKSFDPAKINRGYFPGTRIGGFQAGIAVPLFSGAYRAKVNAEKAGVAVANSGLTNMQVQLKVAWRKAYQEYLKYRQSLDYYRQSGLALASEQIRVAQFAFGKGEIGYMEYIQNISLAVQSRLNYLSVLNQYNNAVINLNYLNGK